MFLGDSYEQNHYAFVFIPTKGGKRIGEWCRRLGDVEKGQILAWGDFTGSVKKGGLAALMGGVASVLFTLLWTSDDVVILFGFMGALAAAILAAMVLPKAE